jgi:hypothetical protein
MSVTREPQTAQRHYVCEAHVPLGEPGNHDDKCPCCEAAHQADNVARLVKALRGILSLIDDGHLVRDDDLYFPSNVSESVRLVNTLHAAQGTLADITKEQKR